MSLLIALHSPVFGYCPEAGSFFLGHYDCNASHDHDDDHCEHDEEPAPSPCDGEHHLLSLDSEDFFWQSTSDFDDSKGSLTQGMSGDFEMNLIFSRESSTGWFPSRPPPLAQSVFRRLLVLRL